jgi:hypothetical protein
MRAQSENFRGIEYIQISRLPVDQKNYIWESINQKLIISILKDDSLLNDCLQYQHYITWYENIFKAIGQEKALDIKVPHPTFTLVFK